MDTLKLISPSEKEAIKIPYFPTNFLAVIFRNFGYVKIEVIADILQTTNENIIYAAKLMGLETETEIDPKWIKRGYLTLIRNNWHLLEYDQLCKVVEMNEGELAFTLKEDDFMWQKMGFFKPCVERAVWRDLTIEEEESARNIARIIKSYGFNKESEKPFYFLDEFYSAPDPKINAKCDKYGDLRMIYSYFAVYGDPFSNEEIDPYPEALLQKYADMGINGVWLQGILYQLVPYEFAPELSKGWENRLETLNKLIKRADKYGIGIYLYLNEPRSMPMDFFENNRDIMGAEYKEIAHLCTSTKRVQDYLYNAVYKLFKKAEGLAGFFTITRSENHTNCYSHSDQNSCNCPRCSKRPVSAVIAEVNNIMAKAAHDANPMAKAIVWDWGWQPQYIEDTIKALDQNQIIQCTSETDIETNIGGIKQKILDYSVSVPGPGKRAQNIWKIAAENGLETCAKTQINNSWECSSIPYLPVFELIEEHINGLKKAGVKHIMMSWTLGGYPTPMLKFASRLMSENITASDFVKYEFDQNTAKAQKIISQAFREFPFNISVLYNAPQNYAPCSPFFTTKTDYSATMIGFPYDDIAGWRGLYPEDVFEMQFEKLKTQWHKGLLMLEEGKCDKLLYTCALSAYLAFSGTLNQIRYVKMRGNPKNKEKVMALLKDEENNVVRMTNLMLENSLIAFEASNHYLYTVRNLFEKLINVDYCIQNI